MSDPSDTKIDLKARDFANPMYEASTSDSLEVLPSSSNSQFNSSNIAILPTTVVQSSSPQITIKQYDPNSEDSGKDTQTLVNEADC